MLARRALSVVGVLVVALVVAGAAAILLRPRPRKVVVPLLDGLPHSVAAAEDGIWVGTFRGFFRLRDGWRPPEEERMLAAEGRDCLGLVVAGGKLWGHMTLRWLRRDGATFTAVPADDPGAPGLPALFARPTVDGDPELGPRLDSLFSGAFTRRGGGVILARTAEGAWIMDQDRQGWLEVAHPDGTFTAYVARDSIDPARARLGEALLVTTLALVVVGGTLVGLARAADVAGRRDTRGGRPELLMAATAAALVIAGSAPRLCLPLAATVALFAAWRGRSWAAIAIATTTVAGALAPLLRGIVTEALR